MPRPSRREEIRRLLARRDREGLTYRELSKISGVAASTLSWWSWRLRRDPISPEVKFAELTVVDPAPNSSTDTTGTIAVSVGDFEVRLNGQVDRATLALVMDELCSRC